MGPYALSRNFGMVLVSSFLFIACTPHQTAASASRENNHVFSLNELFNLDEDLLPVAAGSKTAAIIIPSASSTYSTSPKTASSLKISKSPSSKVTPSNTRHNHNAASDISTLERPLKYVKVSVLPSPEDEVNEKENMPQNPKQSLASETLPHLTIAPQAITSPPQRKRPQTQHKNIKQETVFPNNDGGTVASTPPNPTITTPRPKPAKPWQTTPASFRQASDHLDTEETTGRNSPTRPTVRSRLKTTSRTQNSASLLRQRATPAPVEVHEETTGPLTPKLDNGSKIVNKALQQLQPIFKPMLQASDPTLTHSSSHKNEEHEKASQTDIVPNYSAVRGLKSESEKSKEFPEDQKAPSPQKLPDSIAEILDIVERLKKDKEPEHANDDFKGSNENSTPLRRPNNNDRHESLTPRIVNKSKVNEERIVDFPDHESVAIRGPNREIHEFRPDPVFRPRPAVREPQTFQGDRERRPIHIQDMDTRTRVPLKEREHEFVETENHRLQRPGSNPKPDVDDTDNVTRPPVRPQSTTRVQTRPAYDDRQLQRPLVRESAVTTNKNQNRGHAESHDEQYPIEGLVPHDDSKDSTHSEEDFEETQPIELPLHMLKELLLNAKPTIKEVAIHSDYDPKPKIIHPVRNGFTAPEVSNSNNRDALPLKSAEKDAESATKGKLHVALSRPQDQSGDYDRFKGPLYRNTVAATTFRPTTSRTTASSKTDAPVRGLNPITNEPLYPEHPDALVVPPPKEFLERYKATTTTATSVALEDEDDLDEVPLRHPKIPSKLIQDEDEGSFDTSDEEDFARVTLPPSNYGKKIRDFIQNPNVEVKAPLRDSIRTKGGVSEEDEDLLIRPFIQLNKNKQPTFPRLSIQPKPPTSSEEFIVAKIPLPLSRPTQTRYRDSEIEDHRELIKPISDPKSQRPSGNERGNQESNERTKNRESGSQTQEDHLQEIQPHRISIFHNNQNHDNDGPVEDHRVTKDREITLNRNKPEDRNRQISPKNQVHDVRRPPLEVHGITENHESQLNNERPAANKEFDSRDRRPVDISDSLHRERRPGGNPDRESQDHGPETQFHGDRNTDNVENRRLVENREPQHRERRPGENRVSVNPDRRPQSQLNANRNTPKLEDWAENHRPVESREPQHKDRRPTDNRDPESGDRRFESQLQGGRNTANVKNHAQDRRPVENRETESQDHKAVNHRERDSQDRRPTEKQNNGNRHLDDIRIRYQEAERVHQITPEPPSRIYQPPHKEFEPNWFTPATQPPTTSVTFPPYQEKVHLVAGVTVRPHNIVIEKDFKPIRTEHPNSAIFDHSLTETRPAHRIPESFLSTPRPEPALRPLFRASEEDDSPPRNRGGKIPESENRRTQSHEFNRNNNGDVIQRPVSIHEFRRGNIHQDQLDSPQLQAKRDHESERSLQNSGIQDVGAHSIDDDRSRFSGPPIYIPESLRSQGNRDQDSGRSPLNVRIPDSVEDSRRGQPSPPVYIPESLRSPVNRGQESGKSPTNARITDSVDDRERRPSSPPVYSQESWNPVVNSNSDSRNRPTEAPRVENQRTRPSISLTNPESQVTRRPLLNPQRDPDDLEYRVHTAKDHKKQNRFPRPENQSEDNSYQPPYVPLNETRLQSFTYSDDESKPKYVPGLHRHDKSFPMLPPAPPVALVPEKPVFPTDSENEVVNIPVNKDYAEHQKNLRQRIQDAAKTMPKSVFRCDKVTHPGYYADVEAKCQVFHYCQVDKIRNTFVCPPGTLFNQRYRVCDWWYNVDCENSPDFYFLNEFYGSDAKL